VRVLRPKEAAEKLGISIATLYRWEAEGKLPGRRQIGEGVSGWIDDELEKWINDRPEAGQPERKRT
jgi:excisionase family DNA binding protein